MYAFFGDTLARLSRLTSIAHGVGPLHICSLVPVAYCKRYKLSHFLAIKHKHRQRPMHVDLPTNQVESSFHPTYPFTSLHFTIVENGRISAILGNAQSKVAMFDPTALLRGAGILIVQQQSLHQHTTVSSTVSPRHAPTFTGCR